MARHAWSSSALSLRSPAAWCCWPRGGLLPLLAAGAWLTGFAFRGNLPDGARHHGDRYQRFAGTVFGLLFSIGALGNILLPWAVGHISQAAGVRPGMLVPLAGAIGVSMCASVVLRAEKRVVDGGSRR